MSWLSLLVSLVAGVFLTFLIWTLRTKAYAPKIAWSNRIAYTADNSVPGGYRQFAKVQNTGRRSIVDVHFICIFRVPIENENEKVLLFEIPTVGVPLPVLQPGFTRTISMKTSEIRFDQTYRLPKALLDTINQDPPCPMSQVIGSVEGCSLRMYISATDEISGTRKIFQNDPDYVSDDFQKGRFAEKSLIFIPE
jgi:hypothetical protein